MDAVVKAQENIVAFLNTYTADKLPVVKRKAEVIKKDLSFAVRHASAGKMFALEDWLYSLDRFNRVYPEVTAETGNLYPETYKAAKKELEALNVSDNELQKMEKERYERVRK